MALGYQRIHDLSPLSIKLLNDQLEQLWKKMMGGLETRDMTAKTQAQINAAVTEGRFTSMVEQYADEIRLAVGSSGTDNRVRNGNASFGTEGWTPFSLAMAVVEDASTGEMVFSLDQAGHIAQGGIALRGGVEHTLGFRYLCEAGLSANIAGVGEGERAKADVWTDYEWVFRPEESGEYALKLEVSGPARLMDIYLCEGAGGHYRQNPNEVKNSSITLTDERVEIDTQNFGLVLRNSQGEAVTEMTADSQGFQNLYIAEALHMRGKSMYLGPGRYDLWVHPDADPAGERRFYTSGYSQPPTLEGCFSDIQEAIDYIPKWCDADIVVHIYGGGAWQYPSAKVEIASFFGGGSLYLANWGSPYMIKRMEVRNNAMGITVSGADINSCGSNDCFFVENSTCTFAYCRINGRNVLLGTTSAGFVAYNGARVTLSHCEAHNCVTAAMAMNGGMLGVNHCAGDGNTVGVEAVTGGMITQGSSVFRATRQISEVSGGKVLSTGESISAGTPPAITPMEHCAIFLPTQTATYTRGAWQTSPDSLIVNGAESHGVMWFDLEEMRQALGNRIIVHASLTLRRKGAGGPARGVPISLSTDRARGPSGPFTTICRYGTIGAWAWGERRTVRVPQQVITDMLDATSPLPALAISAEQEASFLGRMENASESLPRLEVVYR